MNRDVGIPYKLKATNTLNDTNDFELTFLDPKSSLNVLAQKRNFNQTDRKEKDQLKKFEKPVLKKRSPVP